MKGKQLALCALFAALIAVCAQVQIPLQPVMVNLALLAVHLAALLLPTRLAVYSTAVYLLMGMIGLPVFAGFRGGVGVLMDYTGGYVLGYLASAALSGRFLRRGARSFASRCAALGAGALLCMALGTTWFMVRTGSPLAAALGLCVAPFVPGDVLKILLAAALARRLEKPLGRLLR